MHTATSQIQDAFEQINTRKSEVVITPDGNFIRPSFDIDAAVYELDANAEASSTGKCATYVRKAIEAGGIKLGRPNSGSAKDYGTYLEDSGFFPVDNTNYSPLKGDVRVIQNYPKGSIHGHIDMYNGTQWVSDFFQNGFWPGQGYREHRPSYTIYRW